VSLGDFANGEIFCRFEESVRGSDAFVIQSHTSPINDWLMEQLIMVDALRRASAKRITVVAPFYPYARQDKKTLAREPITAASSPTSTAPPAPTGSSRSTCTPPRSRASWTRRSTT
jgi:phosphoribosylpyrophosphate synthetase